MSQSPIKPEVFEACLLGQLSDVEAAELDQQLKDDPKALEQLALAMQVMSLVRQEFVSQAEFLAVHHHEPLIQDFSSLLKELAEYEAAADIIELPSQDPACQPPSTDADADQANASGLLVVGGYVLRDYVLSRHGILIGSGLAAAIVLMITLFASDWHRWPQPVAQQPNSMDASSPLNGLSVPSAASIVATLSADSDAVWATATPPAPGAFLRAGERLTLIEGFAEITTARGAVAIIEAPATVELLDSDNAIRLHQGKLVGLCHTQGSKGFVVKTDQATITDLGTEFGVTATPNGTEATVFVGEIAVRTPDAPSQVVTYSRTASITVVDDKPSLVIEDRKQPTEAYTQRLPRAALVTEAEISLPGFDAEVVPNGVYEDVRLFSDRPHELNGIDASGLPAVLIGGDLVRMPASARPDVTPEIADRLQLELELAELSDVYLLVMLNAQVGDWLQRDYQRTGVRTGVDLVGQIPGKVGHFTKGQGPGDDVELTYEVWQRKQPASGRTVIAGSIELSMYSVVVVPRHDDTRLD